jgi:biotin-(acetyl-CoA carboxylase) ligase
MGTTRGIPDAQLIALAEWCRTVVRFLGAHSAPEKQAMYAQFEDGITQGLEGGSTKPIKVLARFLAEWAQMLPPDLNEQLDELLRSKGQTSLGSGAASRAKQVQRILERGVIESDDQYRLLLSRVEETFQDESKQDEVERINALLAKHDRPRRGTE